MQGGPVSFGAYRVYKSYGVGLFAAPSELYRGIASKAYDFCGYFWA